MTADTATVIINITPENEGPGLGETWPTEERVYPENGTDDVSIYLAKDPEGVRDHLLLSSTRSSWSWTVLRLRLLLARMSRARIVQLLAANIVDLDLFEIHSLDGNLSFKASVPITRTQWEDAGNNSSTW